MCDNNFDCPGQEDEGELVACIPFGQNTANGCCASYFYGGNEYTLVGQWQGYDYYQKVGDNTRFLIYYASRNTWYLSSTDGMMNWQGWSFAEAVTPASTDGKFEHTHWFYRHLHQSERIGTRVESLINP